MGFSDYDLSSNGTKIPGSEHLKGRQNQGALAVFLIQMTRLREVPERILGARDVWALQPQYAEDQKD